ncbi:Uncharacterized protein BTT61001_03352 [Bacillus thuringiensis]|uniref:Helix-turn-helix domain-containing protein n=2 Tax=Bacillus TaxID=1386 RepID=A0A1C4EMS8_BACTU|nr:hypothetical protein BK729_06950 [Bacillus thuringiensis serovar wratislaviensis]OUB61333.1 hypothetical protein BK743_08250 [Bacillus thuringiensis serovar sylvestriensis]SCC44884.1 Uncharacterized protein BTT61001_03352 [Bacillus thuringiensis]
MALTEEQRQAQKDSRSRKKEMVKDLELITKKYDEQPFYDKHEKTESGFIKVPRNIMHYMNLQPYGFTTETIFLYQVIIQYTAKDTKYAYPSQYELANLLKKTTSTVKRHIALLKKVGLIRVERANKTNSNRYVPLAPLTEAELLQRYPLAKEYHDEFERSMTEFSASETERMRKYRKEKGRM